MTPVLESILALLIVVTIIVMVVVAVFLVKFLQEATLTMIKVNELTELTKKELEPALKSVNNILSTVNNVSNATNRQLETVKKILTTLLGASCLALTKVKGNGGFFSGLISGFNLFKKKEIKNVNR